MSISASPSGRSKTHYPVCVVIQNNMLTHINTMRSMRWARTVDVLIPGSNPGQNRTETRKNNYSTVNLTRSSSRSRIWGRNPNPRSTNQETTKNLLNSTQADILRNRSSKVTRKCVRWSYMASTIFSKTFDTKTQIRYRTVRARVVWADWLFAFFQNFGRTIARLEART